MANKNALNMPASKYPAKTIVLYMDLYKDYLMSNGLADDSKEISVDSLINFVEDEGLKDPG